MHVVDASDPLPEDQITAVRQVLVEIGEEHGGRMPQELLVVNKCDAAGDLALARLRHLLPDAVFVSARRGDGIERLRARIAELLPRPDVDVELLLPYTEGSWPPACTPRARCSPRSTPPTAPGCTPGWAPSWPQRCCRSAPGREARGS